MTDMQPQDRKIRTALRRALLRRRRSPRVLASATGLSPRRAEGVLCALAAPERKAGPASPGETGSDNPASRLQWLVERRLAAFERLLKEADSGETSIVELERQSKALVALVKALEASAAMESRLAKASPVEDGGRVLQGEADGEIRRILARRLEGLLAGAGPARPAGGADGG